MAPRHCRRFVLVGGVGSLLSRGATAQISASQKIATEMLQRFPIKATPISDIRVTSDHSFWVGVPKLQISLNRTAPADQVGRYDASVHVESKEALAGFQGGVYYTFSDEHGNIVYAIMGDIYGVNGTVVPGAPSDVTRMEAKIIPLEVLTAVYSVSAVPTRLEGSVLDNVKKLVGDFARGAEAIKDDLKKIGATVADIAAALKAAG